MRMYFWLGRSLDAFSGSNSTNLCRQDQMRGYLAALHVAESANPIGGLAQSEPEWPRGRSEQDLIWQFLDELCDDIASAFTAGHLRRQKIASACSQRFNCAQPERAPPKLLIWSALKTGWVASKRQLSAEAVVRQGLLHRLEMGRLLPSARMGHDDPFPGIQPCFGAPRNRTLIHLGESGPQANGSTPADCARAARLGSFTIRTTQSAI